MKNPIAILRHASLALLLGGGALPAIADFDYFGGSRQNIRNGVDAVLTCNGLFTSHRSMQQVTDQELAYVDERRFGLTRATVATIDRNNRAVTFGGNGMGAPITAVFREGIGCVVMAPDQTTEDIDSLPAITLAPPAGDPAEIDWPMGDRLPERPLPAAVDADALEAAARWAFERDTPEQDTLSLMVVHKGQVLLERYAEGVDMHTRTRTWSTAKSIAAALIGIQVDRGEMALDEPLGVDWLPEMGAAEQDPRDAITLRQVLRMSSGLEPIDSFGREYVTGSGLSYWAGASSAVGARSRGLMRTPGSFWDYENYDTLLAVMAFRQSLPDTQTYHEFPRRELLDRIGMRNTLLSTDRFGDFILSSQVYTNARDLARFGLLFLNNGIWQGERLLSKEWVDFVRTPAPASAVRGSDYGAQFWLVPDKRKGEVPADAYSTAGNRGQFVIIDPSHDLVIVRRGLDYGRQGFDRWDLLREVLKAFPSGD